MPKTVQATEEPKTLSQQTANEVRSLLRARNPLLWIVTKEEPRVELFLYQAIVAAGYKPRTWDTVSGVTLEIRGKPNPELADADIMLNSVREAATQAVAEKQQRGAWILRDLPVWMSGGISGARTLRNVRNLARMLPGVPRETAQAMIILSPSGEVPPELTDHATVINWPLPDRAEIGQLLASAIEAQGDKMTPMTNAVREAAIDAAVGLTGEEANATFARSLTSKRIDPKMIAQEKKRIVARSGGVEWYDPIPGGLDAVGGLDVLKGWLIRRKAAFTPEAKEYGLPSPKGMLLIGITGCGKTLTAKATSTAFNMPLLRLDLGALQSKYVGDSQRNLRNVFELIKAIGQCVVWIDEIEKALAGATQGAADGGVSADALGAILSWMQERQGEAFVIATANDVRGLPPELLRKGRFDEVWFVDLPNPSERIEVLKAALKANGRAQVKLDLSKIGAACDKFTGAEIAAIVPDAMFNAFEHNREIKTQDLIEAAEQVTPVSKTMSAKIEELRDWAVAKGNARLATSRAVTRVTSREGVRQVDTDEEEDA